MSYCRFSSEDFGCDVYCYAGGGYMTQVATTRYVFTQPLPPPVSEDDTGAWMQRWEAVMHAASVAPVVAIGGPHDGELFEDPDPASAADRLEALRAAGYRVPQYAIDQLRAEASEEGTSEEG
jgi:hypothetical protein